MAQGTRRHKRGQAHGQKRDRQRQVKRHAHRQREGHPSEEPDLRESGHRADRSRGLERG
jgi:hypothetical protein